MMTTKSTPNESQQTNMEYLGFKLEETPRCGESVWRLDLPGFQEIALVFDDAALPKPANIIKEAVLQGIGLGRRLKAEEIKTAMLSK